MFDRTNLCRELDAKGMVTLLIGAGLGGKKNLGRL
jgi:hypothetical protein